MTLEQAKQNLEREVETPDGPMILYGINLLPDSEAVGLIFYPNKGERLMFFADDCNVIKTHKHTFPEALRLLRALADVQNGPPLEKYRAEWEGVMREVWAFLEEYEEE